MDYTGRFRPNKRVIFPRLEVYMYKWFGIAQFEIQNKLELSFRLL